MTDVTNDDLIHLKLKGYVTRSFDSESEREAWRAEIQRHARERGLRIRTGFPNEHPLVTWAVRVEDE